MNKALFFPLFVNDFDELALTTLKRKYGIKGYGVYTFLRTKLQDVDNYEYPIKLIPDLAYLAGIPEIEMNDIIYNSNLFVVGNEYFSCPLLDEALNRHNGIKEKKTVQGKNGGITRMSTLNEEQRKELSRKAHEARYSNKKPKVGINSGVVPASNSEVVINSGVALSNGNNAGSAGINLPANARNLPSNEIEIDIEMEIERENESEIDIESENESERDIDIDNESKTVSGLASDLSLISSKVEENIPIEEIKKSVNPIDKVQEGKVINSTPTLIYNYSTSEVSYQIEKYLKTESKFFYRDNRNIVANGYTQFYNEYPTTVATIEGYEQVLYMYLKSSLSTFDKFIDNVPDLNDVLDNTQSLTITPISIMDLMKAIKANKKDIREAYNKIIAEVQNTKAIENL